MKKVDGHMHLEYGDLSVEYVMEFVNRAKEVGLDKIQILDHTHRFKEFYHLYDDLREIEVQRKWLDNPKYKFHNTLDEFIALKNEVQAMDLGIEVAFGLEICYVPGQEEFIKNIVSKYDFDFLVGSIHSIDGRLYDMGFSKSILWDVIDTDTIYKRYYEIVFDLVKSDLFDQIGHVDTIKMFNYYPSYDLTPTYLEFARLCKEHHVIVENNTGASFRYGHSDIGLNKELLKILRDNGNEMITASDSHRPFEVGTNLDKIFEATML